MLCCISSSSTVDDGITETSEERRQRIVPGFNRPESELDWEEITVFQWPNDDGSEGYQRPASTIGSQAAENIARQHQARLAALNNPAVRQSNDISEAPPVNVSKKKKQGLFAKKSSKNRPAPGPPKEGERLPGDINRVPAPPPLPPGRDDLPHLTARRLTSQTTNNNSSEQPNGQVHESTHRKAIPLHGNLQLNFSVPGRSEPDDIKSVHSGTAADTTDNRRGRNKSKADGSKRSKFSLKIKRPTFLSDSAFGTNKKTRKSPKSYRAPDPPGFHPPSSIDTSITEDRLPLGDKMQLDSRLDTIEEPQHWERDDINNDEDDFDVSLLHVSLEQEITCLNGKHDYDLIYEWNVSVDTRSNELLHLLFA